MPRFPWPRRARVAAGLAAILLLGPAAAHRVLPLTGPAGPDAAAAEATCRDRETPGGRPLSSVTVLPQRMEICHTAEVMVRVRLDCPGPALNVVLNVDRSGSMVGQSIADARAALRGLADRLLIPGHPDVNIGLVSHGQPPTVDQPLAHDAAALGLAIGRLDVASESVPDDLPGAIDASAQVLLEARRAGERAAVEVIVVVSDGGQSFAAQAVSAAVDRAHDLGLVIAGVCIENRLANCGIVEEAVSRPELYLRATDGAALAARLSELAGALAAMALPDLSLAVHAPAGLRVVPGSAAPPALPEPGGLRWEAGFLPRSGLTMTYRLAAVAEGAYRLPPPVASVGGPGGRRALPFVDASLEVRGRCGQPSPEPSPTARPTAVALEPAYLPALVRAYCPGEESGLDLVVLLDASSSMDGPADAGRSKLQAALAAILALRAGMKPQDQVGLVAFHDNAWPAAPLDATPDGFAAALAGVRTAPGTRMDLALGEAERVLAGPARRPASPVALVLFSDGRADADSAKAAGEAAGRLRAAGARIVAVGVGTEADLPQLAALTGRPDLVYSAADGAAIAAVYRRVAEALPCR